MDDQQRGPPTLPIDAYRLRPMRLDDEAAWHDYLRLPEVTEHTSFPAIDRSAVRRSVDKVLAGYASNGPYRWALADAQDVLVGTCGFPSWSLDHGHAELAYDLHPDHQHHGLMTRAVQVVVQWVFSRRPIHRVHAFVMTSNRPSIALLERCGFEREGTLKGFRIARGVPRDFHLHARLKGPVHAP